MSLQVTGQSQGVLTASQKSGAPPAVNTGWHNELLKSDLFPRYAYLSLNGKVFAQSWPSAALAAPTASTVGAFGLVNNVGSSVNLVLLDVILGVTAAATSAATGTAFALATVPGNQAVTAQTQVTGGPPPSTLLGSALLAAGKTVTAGTIVGTPVAIRNIGWINNDSVTTQTFFMLGGVMKDETAGTIVIAPGGFVNLVGIGGTPANFSVTMTATWAELPL